MQIDWFTYGAQIVNFLILIYLLRRFLYGPILNAMATRTENLHEQFAEAERKAAEAEALATDFRQRQATLEAEKSTILSDAMADVDRRRRAMILDAREEVESMQNRWYAAVEQDKARFLHELRVHVSDQLFALSRRVLNDLAHTELERAMVTLFCEKVMKLDASTRHSIARSLSHTSPVVTINTSFCLADDLREQIDKTVQQLFTDEQFPNAIHVRFKQNPALITGIELIVQERRVAWSVDDHLQLLEKQLTDALDDALAERDNHTAIFATAENGS